MGMEGIEKNNSLSAEQQEKLDAFLNTIMPFITLLNQKNEERYRDQILEEAKKFKSENPDISDEQINNLIKNQLTSQQ